MNRFSTYLLSIAALLVASSAGFSQMSDMGLDGGHFGPGMMDGRSFHHEMMSPGLHAIIRELHLETTLETFHVNVEKIRIDAAEKKIPLKEKARISMSNLKNLVKKYAKDKTVSKDIVQALKDLNGARIAIRQIDKDTFTKIRALKDGLDSDIDKAVDSYIQKLSAGGAELDDLAKDLARDRAYEEINVPMEMEK